MYLNFDYRDIVSSCDLIKEYFEQFSDDEDYTLSSYIFHADNNDGKLIIDVDRETEVIRYAFLDCDNRRIGDGREYLEWDRFIFSEEEPEVIEFTKENLHWLDDNTELMTNEQVVNFLNTFTVGCNIKRTSSSEENGCSELVQEYKYKVLSI